MSFNILHILSIESLKRRATVTQSYKSRSNPGIQQFMRDHTFPAPWLFSGFAVWINRGCTNQSFLRIARTWDGGPSITVATSSDPPSCL